MSRFQIECLELRENLQEHYGRFIIQPFRAECALTFGNALRRTLLTSLKGSAIVGVDIIGVPHEFSVIPGLREDTLELLLNIKEIILINEDEFPCFATLNVAGPLTITAGDIDFPPHVKLINPSHYLGTLSENIELEIDFKIENGVGYRLAKPIRSSNELDFLEVDAIFMPVKRVNFSIEKLYKDENDFIERLIFEVWTNGTISPKEALMSACEILHSTFYGCLTSLINVNPPQEKIPIIEEKIIDLEQNKNFVGININDLKLSNRAYNGLKQANITNLQELIDVLTNDPKQLKQVRNFGKKSFQEVLDVLKEQFEIFIDTKIK